MVGCKSEPKPVLNGQKDVHETSGGKKKVTAKRAPPLGEEHTWPQVNRKIVKRENDSVYPRFTFWRQ